MRFSSESLPTYRRCSPGSAGPGPERGMEPEAKRQGGHPAAIVLGIDCRHHGVDLLVGVPVDAFQNG
jgi:hypothetical protein